jgi:hypothetical protein
MMYSVILSIRVVTESQQGEKANLYSQQVSVSMKMSRRCFQDGKGPDIVNFFIKWAVNLLRDALHCCRLSYVTSNLYLDICKP